MKRFRSSACATTPRGGRLAGAFAVGLLLGASARAEAQVGGPGVAAAPVAAATPRVMTLPDALAYARGHQPALRAALARVAAQTEDAKVPRAQWIPSVGATAQIYAATANNTTGTYVNAPFVDVMRIGGTAANGSPSYRPYAATIAGVGLNQEVFDFGRIAAQSAAADALVDVARHSADTERLDTDFAVEEAYFAVYAAKAIVVASDDAYARAAVHEGLAKAGVVSGLRSPIEATRAEADLARFDVGRVHARAGLTVAQTVLAAAVGVPEPAVDVSATAPGTREMPSLAAAIRAAADRDPQILEVEARLRAQEGATQAIGAQLRPDLALTSTLSARAGGAPASGTGDVPTGAGLLPDVPNWDVGLILSWPVWNGPVLARKRASKAREQVERENLSLIRFQRATAIQQAYVAVTVARAELPALQRSVDAALANYAQADARFKAGLGNAVELADAEALRTQAEIDLAVGQFDLARSRVAFGRAIAEEL